MPVFVFDFDIIFDKLLDLGQISPVIPYYIEIKDLLYLRKCFINRLKNCYKIRTFKNSDINLKKI